MSHESTSNEATHDELMHVEGDNINTGLLSVIFALCAVSVVLVVVLLQAWFYNLTSEVTMAPDRLKEDPQNLAVRVRNEEQAKISNYQWANRDTHTMAIPIDRAMEIVVKELHTAAPAAGEKPSLSGKGPTS